MNYTIPFILAASLATPATADISVRFIEGAPKDRFVFAAETTDCLTGPVTLTVDLEGSAGGLIFDVTDAGAGVEVFQPFELTSGAGTVSDVTPVSDGDTQLSLTVQRFPSGAEVSFTIDVDDTLGARAITVSQAEIVGASVRLTTEATRATAIFESGPSARIVLPDCTS